MNNDSSAPMPDPASERLLSHGARPTAVFPDADVVPGVGDAVLPVPPGVANGWVPKLDVVEFPEYYLLLIDAPGAQTDRVEVTLTSGILTLFIKRPESAWPETAVIHRAERDFGNAFRSLKVPEDAASTFDVAATNGVVSIRIRRDLKTVAEFGAPGEFAVPGKAHGLPEAPMKKVNATDEKQAVVPTV